MSASLQAAPPVDDNNTITLTVIEAAVPAPQIPLRPGVHLSIPGMVDGNEPRPIRLAPPRMSSIAWSPPFPAAGDVIKPRLGRVPRAFPLPLPRAIWLREDGENARIVPPSEQFEEFRRISILCKREGPAWIVVRGSGRASWLAIPIIALVSVACCVLGVVGGDFGWSSYPRVQRFLRFAVFTFANLATFAFILFSLFQNYPVLTRNMRGLALALLPLGIGLAMWMLRQVLIFLDIYSGSMSWTLFFVWFYYLGPFVAGKFVWHHLKKGRGEVTHPVFWWRGILTPGGSMRTLMHVTAVIVAIGAIVSDLKILALGPAAFVIIIPFAVAFVLWGLFSSDLSWSGGFAIAVPMLLFSMVAAPQLLSVIMAMPIFGRDAIGTLIKFLAFYLVYGCLFSIAQATVSLATESYHAPQYMFILQMFLESYMGLSFSSLSSTSAFILTLACQSLWALFQNTGLRADAYIRVKYWLLNHLRKKQLEPITVVENLSRMQFFFLLNAQGILCDLLNAVLIPLAVVIDRSLPWGVCSTSCDVGDINTFLIRYLVVFICRSAAAVIVTIAYCVRLSYITYGRQGISFRRMMQAGSALFCSFRLHLWRNLVLFSSTSMFLYLFWVRPLALAGASSGSASSSSS